MRALARTILGTAIHVACSGAHGAIVFYDNDFAGWQSVSAPYTTIDFTGFPALTIITDQYQPLGVTFTNPTPDVIKHIPNSFPLDEWGIDANGYLELTFSQLMHSIGAHVPGHPKIQLFAGNVMIGQTDYADQFLGATSDIGFDRARFVSIQGMSGQVFMDNLYFSTVPAPSGVVLFLFALARRGCRRRPA